MNRRDFARAGLGWCGLTAGLTLPATVRVGFAQGEQRQQPAGSGNTATPVSFALIGDTPYNALEERALVRVLDDIAEHAPAFAIHVGDLKSGWEPCSDELFERRRALLAASRVPLAFVPGDNEWLDCRRAIAGGHDPLERLARLRELFHRPDSVPRPPPGTVRQEHLGQACPENQRWRAGAALFVTLNLPGSRNGASDDPHRQPAHALRNAANEAWLREAFAIAARERLPGVVVAIHANPGFERDHGAGGAALPAAARDAYRAFRDLLRDLVADSGAQVLLLHGDTHRFRADAPLLDARGRPLRNFRRVESYGSPFASAWVRIGFDPRGEPGFAIEPRHLETGSN